MQYYNKIFLNFLLLFILLFHFFASGLEARGGKGLDAIVEEDVKAEESNRNKSSFKKMLLPRVGLAYSPFVPTGEMANYMAPGLSSAYFFGKFKLPVKEIGLNFLAKMGLEFTIRTAVGYSSLNSTAGQADSANLKLIPFHAGMDFSYPLKGVLKKVVLIAPYFGFDFGASMTSMEFSAAPDSGKKSTNASSVDGIMGLSVGSTFRFKSLSVIEFYTDFRLLRFLEKENSDFLMLSFGIGYIL